MDEVYTLFEKYMLVKQNYPKWYEIDDEGERRMKKLFDSGFAYPLTEKTIHGARVIFIQTRRLDTKMFNVTDSIRLIHWIARVVLEEEETQIAGILTVVDQSELTLAHCRMFSVTDTYDMVSVTKSAVVGRQKGLIMVSLPSSLSVIFDVAHRIAPKKLREKVSLCRDMAALKNIVPEDLLPSEFGGKISERDMMKKFQMEAAKSENSIKSIDSSIDWSEYEKWKSEHETGSSCTVM